jgi:hypothetical protein
MSGATARVFYIPDYFTFTYCKEDKKSYQQYLKEYACSLEEDIDDIVEEAGVELYDAIKELKEDGVYYIAQYSGDSRKMGGMYALLNLFLICEFDCGGGGYDDAYINLNTNYHRTNEKLELLIKLNLKKQV